jgi:aryl-alcohol dehydrogenase-like predicted oxidoreductase
MEFRNLGKTGLRVSELCLGTMTFARETDEATSLRMIDRFIEAGGNFIDTADVYTTGRSEEIVGKGAAGASAQHHPGHQGALPYGTRTQRGRSVAQAHR